MSVRPLGFWLYVGVAFLSAVSLFLLISGDTPITLYWQGVGGRAIRDRFGFELGQITFPDGDRLTTIWAFTKVVPGGPLDLAGVRPGDTVSGFHGRGAGRPEFVYRWLERSEGSEIVMRVVDTGTAGPSLGRSQEREVHIQVPR